jgi:hypothetical protein
MRWPVSAVGWCGLHARAPLRPEVTQINGERVATRGGRAPVATGVQEALRSMHAFGGAEKALCHASGQSCMGRPSAMPAD